MPPRRISTLLPRLMLCGPLFVGALAASAPPGAAQADKWQEKINHYVNRGYQMIVVTRTPEVVVVYLCHPGGRARWAYKLTNTALLKPNLKLHGVAVYNTYDVKGRGQGEGVFLGHDPGPRTERARIKDERFPPLPWAATSIQLNTEAGPRELQLGKISPKAIAEIASKCVGSSFPRVLHQCVPVGHAAPCRPAGNAQAPPPSAAPGGPWFSINPKKNCGTICLFGNCPSC
jgi:hypothetical protein